MLTLELLYMLLQYDWCYIDDVLSDKIFDSKNETLEVFNVQS